MIAGGAERADNYVEAVLSGKHLVPDTIRDAAERWRALHREPGVSYDREYLDGQIRNVERLYCPEGAFGKFELMEWQCWLCSWIWGFRDEFGNRLVRELTLIIPRKAGKTSLMSVILLLELVKPYGGGRKPDIVLYGINEDTCNIAKRKILSILSADATHGGGGFSRRFGVKHNKALVSCNANGGQISAIPLGSKSLEGQTPHAAFVDELSTIPNADPLNIIRTSFASAKSPLLLTATTAGDLPHSCHTICREEALRWLAGDDARTGYAALLYEASPEADIQDEKVWFSAQPSLGHIVSKDWYRSQAEAAGADEKAKENFRARLLCIPRAGGYGGWIDGELFDQTPDPIVATARELRGKIKRCWIGLDLADFYDTCAMCVLAEMHDDSLCAFFHGWYPAAQLAQIGSPERSGLENMRQWADAGWITLTPGKQVDHQIVAQHIAGLVRALRPVSITADQWNAIYDVRDALHEMNIDTDRLLQIVKKSRDSYSLPMQTARLWIDGRKIAMEKNPFARTHFSNCIVMQAGDGGTLIQKQTDNSPHKIDAADAFIMTLIGYLKRKQAKFIGTPAAPLDGRVKPSSKDEIILLG